MRKALVSLVGATAVGLAGCDEIVVVSDPEIITNKAPEFVDIPGPQEVVEGKELRLTLVATDPEGTKITYTMAGNPDGATLDADTGVFIYSPAFSVSSLTENKTFEVKFRATDAATPQTASVDTPSITITILNDLDEDGEADRTDLDKDGDGLDNTVEVEQTKTDPNDADSDDDTIVDGDDNCPKDSNQAQTDVDGDDVGDICDECPNDKLNDSDGDLVCDSLDNCPEDANAVSDCDSNPATPDTQCDDDEDGVGDACDACPNDKVNDPDLDGICAKNAAGEALDNCPVDNNIPSDCDNDGATPNEQCDKDDDGFGDVCDTCPNDASNDVDGDTVCEDVDNCPGVKNDPVGGVQGDIDDDGDGDACDTDKDGDGKLNTADNCPEVENADQANFDEDGEGDACDSDDDDDTVLDDADNCQFAANPHQLDYDGDEVGFQCDSNETIPFSLHEGSATRITGAARAGTVAIGMRGPNPCTGAGCVKPGVFVVNVEDEEYAKRQDTADSTTAWLNLAPPAADLLTPYVSQAGVAYFPTQGAPTTSGYDIRKVDGAVATPAFTSVAPISTTPPIPWPPVFTDGPDGSTLVEGKLTGNPGVYQLDVLTNGQPTQLQTAASFKDRGGNGPFHWLDDTVYYPYASATSQYSLYAYRRTSPTASATHTVVKVPEGASSLDLTNRPDITFVAPDATTGGAWYCYRKTTSDNPEYILLVNGAVTKQHKPTFGSHFCSAITATRSPGGVWFFAGPAPTSGRTRVRFWDTNNADPVTNSGDLYTAGQIGTADNRVRFHFAGQQTFVERCTVTNNQTCADTTSPVTFEWFNATTRAPVALGAPLYRAAASVNSAGWIGFAGRRDATDIQDTAILARRYQGGVSTTPEEGNVATISSVVGAGANAAWVSPAGWVWVNYDGDFKFKVFPVGASIPTASFFSAQPNQVNVTFHGPSTIVSRGVASGNISYATVSNGNVTLTSLGAARGVHSLFRMAALPMGTTSDDWITYVDGTQKAVVARVVSGATPSLSNALTGLDGPPANVMAGRDGRVWFTWEKAGLPGFGSTDATSFSALVQDMAEVTPVMKNDLTVTFQRTSLWGAFVRNGAGELYACRIPVTTGEVLAGGCWMVSDATDAVVQWSSVDEAGRLYAVTSSGSPVSLTLTQTVGDPELAASSIPAQ